MNKDWIDFLQSNDAVVTSELDVTFPENKQKNDHTIAPVTNLSLVKITGTDAAQFLQGQFTCNIKELTESISFFTAFCNAKGRTISSLLIYKKDDVYYLILPNELADKVISKLQMYVMRSNVQIQNVSSDFCLIGLTTTDSNLLANLPENQFNVNKETIKLPSKDHRYLMINSLAEAMSTWTQLIQNNNVTPVSSTLWLFQDICTGIPWLSQVTSEEYIPQMLNIDKLGGISFNKGCYTGQEIIARTHYLGKTKRELFLVECSFTAMLDLNNQIFTNDSKQPLGKIISIQSNNQTTRMLTVMQSSDTNMQRLTLNNPDKDEINIIDFQ
ncbi:MAG: folate-binding protein YgfZ [Methylococcales bacterium]|nr:folate-binding protein YgfZ [Methylococcales bacterium]